MIARFYDWESRQFLRRQMLDIGFYRELAARCGGAVLELGAGTGRVTIPLAQAGFSVCAVDLSESALAQAAAKAAVLGKVVEDRITFVQGDMRSFDVGRRFPLVIVPYNSFQVLLTQADQRACLSRVMEHLDDGGLLAMELCPFQQRGAEAETPRQHLATDYSEDGASVIAMYESATNDFANQLTHFHEEYQVFKPGEPVEVIDHTLTLRTVHRYEMELLFEATGFTVQALYGNYEFGPYPDAEMESMLYVAGRRV